MPTLRRALVTAAPPDRVWDAIRDVGALHTRLVPGFVVDTRLEPGARVVTFGNGMVVREPLVSIEDDARRLVWGAETSLFTHYNAALQVFVEGAGSRVVWTADFLPDSAESRLAPLMDEGLSSMKKALDALA